MHIYAEVSPGVTPLWYMFTDKSFHSWIHSLWSCVSPTASCCQVSRWTTWSSLLVGYNYCQWVKCQVVTRLLRANALTDWLLFPQVGRNPFPQVSTQEILQFTKSPEERSANFSGLLEGKMPSLLEVKKEPNKWIPWSCQTHWNTTKDFYFSLVSFTSFRDPLLFTLSSNCSFFHVLTFRHPMRSRWRWTKLKQRKGGDLTPCSTSLSPHE